MVCGWDSVGNPGTAAGFADALRRLDSTVGYVAGGV